VGADGATKTVQALGKAETVFMALK